MSLVIVETTSPEPITDEYLHQVDQIALPCFQAHRIHWRYSLLSTNRHRMICTFDAPDAASVREVYAQFGLSGRLIWTGELMQSQGIQQTMPDLYVIEAHYPPLNLINWNDIQQTFVQCCTDAGVQWLCSYLSLDRTRLIHELDAADDTALEIVQQKSDISPKNIWFARRLRSS